MVNPRKSPGLKMMKKMNKNKIQNSFSCPECGAESTEDQKFCKKCGKQFSENNTPMNKKILKLYILSQLGHEKHFLKNHRCSKKVGKVIGQGMWGCRIANKTRKKIKAEIESGEITTTAEIDSILENAHLEYEKIINGFRIHNANQKKLKEEQKKPINKEEKMKLMQERIKIQLSSTTGIYCLVTLPEFEIKQHSATTRHAATVYMGLPGLALTSGTQKKPKVITTFLRMAEKGLVIKKGLNDTADLKISWEQIITVVGLKNKFKINLVNGSNIKITIPRGSIPDSKHSARCIISILKPMCKGVEDEGWSSGKNYQSKNTAEITAKPEEIVSENEEDPINQIKKLNELKEAGILTDEEFKTKKKELLERI